MTATINTNRNGVAVGIVGAGGMGFRHAMNIRDWGKGAYVAGVYDPDAERAGRVAAECGEVVQFDSAGALIEDERTDAVIVASPDHTHVEFTLNCLDAGKPVLCEKPLATSADSARRVVDAEVEIGRQLVTVGFMRRFDPAHLAVRESAGSGRIGTPWLYKGVHRNRSAPPASPEEHFIHQSAVHDIDAARWLLGSEVERVYVRGARLDSSLDEAARDLILIDLDFTSGAFAAIELHLSARYGYEVAVELVGDSGSVATLPPDRHELWSEGQRSRSVPPDWLERFEEAYIGELRHWITSVAENGAGDAGATPWDGFIALLVADACVESLETGEPVDVTGPSMPALY
ncbi:MAG: Gfo/Idh/MocA family oxidoreductase [Balneolaceae bacterium]|nr:Gfo/Idh/MocA family oxidoreductase [Balneolaceae bacterium]